MRSSARSPRRRLVLLLAAILPITAGLRDSCGIIPTYQSVTGVKGAEDLDYSELAARRGKPPAQTTAQTSCDNAGAGGAPSCPAVGTPVEAREAGAQDGTAVDARVSTVSNSQGFRVDWSISQTPDGSGASAALVTTTLEADARFGSRYFQSFSSAQNGIEVAAYDVKWGGAGTVLRTCTLEVTVQGQAPVIVPANGTPTLVLYDASSAPAGLPVEYALRCDVVLPNDCADVPPGTPCQLVAPPFDVAGHLAVEIGSPRRTCRSDAMCDAAAPFCVSGTCREGTEGARCNNPLDCAAGLFCGGNGRCVDGGAGDVCQSDLDCPNAAGCAQLFCRDGNEGDYCDDASDCSAGAPFCVRPAGQFTGFCGRGALGSFCASTSDCGSGLDCLGPAFNPTCVQCTTSADCANGGFCLGGVCTSDMPELCTTNAQCTSPEVCRFQGLGQPQRCFFDCFTTNPCSGAGEICAGDRCLECVADTDCGPGRMCLAERCVGAP